MKPYYSDKYVTIFHGDCRDILPSLEPVDLVLTDPPYGVPVMIDGSFKGGAQRAANGRKYEAVIGNEEEFDPAPFLIGKVQILWGANHYAHRLPHNGRWLVWDKRCQQQPVRTQADCELAWCSIYGAARIFYHVWDGMIKDSEKNERRYHPTQKPVALMAWCLSLSPDSKTVLDPFMGCGSTLVAAKKLSRISIGIELDEKYCEVAANRLMQEVMELNIEPDNQNKQELLL